MYAHTYRSMSTTWTIICVLFVMQRCYWDRVAAAETPTIISKTDWNGVEASDELTKLSLPAQRIIICHTAGAVCHNQQNCGQQLLSMQTFHMKSYSFSDISYNFLIGGDGNVYEGRGWEYMPAVARSFNNGSIAIAFIGSYNKELPVDNALEAARNLLTFGVDNNKIATDYKLFGHRQLSATESPGSVLYDEIKQWPHWSRSLN